jgi:serine/threonine-protein kinase
MGIFDRDRWRRLQPLLDQALDLSSEYRVSWLDELRSSHPEIADDLIALLSSETAADDSGFLVTRPK